MSSIQTSTLQNLCDAFAAKVRHHRAWIIPAGKVLSQARCAWAPMTCWKKAFFVVFSISLLASCGGGRSSCTEQAPDQLIGAAISGVTAPVRDAAPVTSVSGTGYTGTVTWSPAVSGTFAPNTAYTATVTLSPATGYTVTGATANYFTVAGATATQAANSGMVSAVFPATQNQLIGAAISGVTAPVRGAAPVSSVSGVGYTGTVTWSPAVSSTFEGGTAYTATVTLTAATGYTVTGVTANHFTVTGATATNAANSGVVSAVFPSTEASPGFFTVNGVTSTPPSLGGYVNYATAFAYCRDLMTANKAWRIPTFGELTALNTALVNAGYDNTQPPDWPPLSQTWSSTSNGSGGYRTRYMPYSLASEADSRLPTELAVTLCVTTD